MGSSYTGNPASIDLDVAVAITEPVDADPQNAATYNLAFEKLANVAEASRRYHGISLFGPGVDGDAAFDGSNAVTGCSRSGTTYTALRDLLFNDATISNAVTLKMVGFRLYVAGRLTMGANAVIHCNGNAGSGGTAGAVAGSLLSSLYAGGAGGAAGNAGVGATNAVNALGGAGGAGGIGGVAGGAGGTATAPAATAGSVYVPATMTTGFVFGVSGGGPLQGGGGGGGGDGGAAGGGGGGGPGGVLLIAAREISMDATAQLQAKGAAGVTRSGAGEGGGGGGGGGAVMLTYRHPLTIITFDVSGGAGGGSGAGTTASVAGSAGGIYPWRV